MNTYPVALVTGASSGIGAATAAALVDNGFVVVGTSRNASKVAPVEGVTVVTVVEGLIADHGRIDVSLSRDGAGDEVVEAKHADRDAQFGYLNGRSVSTWPQASRWCRSIPRQFKNGGRERGSPSREMVLGWLVEGERRVHGRSRQSSG